LPWWLFIIPGRLDKSQLEFPAFVFGGVLSAGVGKRNATTGKSTCLLLLVGSYEEQ
jgi:hypothetical protein